MSDRTHQALANLTFEVTQLATDYVSLAKRLHDLNSDLVSASDVQAAKQRVIRLRSLFQGLQKQAKEE